MRQSKRAQLVLLGAMAVAFGGRVSAHRLDELLQAARIGIVRDRVHLEMDLTPGTVVADAVIRQIDVDRNGVLSPEEQQAYAGRVLGALTLSVDDSPQLRMQPGASIFPDPAALRAGDGTIIIRSEAVVARLPVGPHRLFFRNKSAAADSVYLANALAPENDEVAVTRQQRAADQSELTIEFVVRGGSASRSQWGWIGVAGLLMLTVSLTRRTRARPSRAFKLCVASMSAGQGSPPR